MTINYLNGQQNHILMQRYGFSSSVYLKFLSSQLADTGDNFIDGAVIAAVRTLPTWSYGDVPPIPNLKRKVVKELQEECQQMLAQFPTTSE
ncbi:hypothetical protein REPUB_Repub18cG0063800 [Reevesia pubescens]